MRIKLMIERPDHPADRHHVFHGSYRKAAERWGCVKYLPHVFHIGTGGPHQNAEYDRRLKAGYQQLLEEAGWTREEFMETFGRNYR